MRVRNLSNADKYLLLGNILKKFNSERTSRQALEIVKSTECLEDKLTAVLKLYRKGRGTEALHLDENYPSSGKRIPSPESANHRGSSFQMIKEKRGKPRILIMDPRSEISRALSSSSLRGSYTFIHTEKIYRQASQVRRYHPRAVIMNMEEELSACLELSQDLMGIHSDAAIIILCTKSQYKQALEDESAWENTYLITKPLNLVLLTDVLQQAVIAH